MKVIVQVEFKFDFYDVTVEPVSHYFLGTPFILQLSRIYRFKIIENFINSLA